MMTGTLLHHVSGLKDTAGAFGKGKELIATGLILWD
jgi:hypothetical protein